MESLMRRQDTLPYPFLRYNPINTATAKPFVKWAGGKRSIMKELIRRLPQNFENYYEPFLGGGALFFALRNMRPASRFHLSDTNPHLINTWQIIQRDVETLIERLRQHQAKHNSHYYYYLRSLHSLKAPIDQAARFIYLNKSCFNGLYRVNRKGQFNVAIGSGNPTICEEDNLRACHHALQGVDIQVRDFIQIDVSEGDFVYFDPPYHFNTVSSSIKYTKEDFGPQQQIALRDFCLLLHRQGAKIMLSNSNTEFIRELYDNVIFHIDTIQALRQISRDVSKRGPVKEFLMTNYEVSK